MKKILFVTSLYHPHIGGIETMVTDLSSFYQRRGLETVCVTKRWPITLPAYERYAGMDIYRVISAKNEKEFHELITWIKLNESKIKADIIHVIGTRRPLPLLGLLLARRWKVPIICTVAGGEIPDKVDSRPARVWNDGIEIIPNVLKQSDNVTCVSSALARDLKELVPEIENIDVLYAGLQISEIELIPAEKIKEHYIFSLRRLDPSKGVDILIKAFSLIEKRFPWLYLVIAGEGEEEPRLKQLSELYHLTDKVIFLGTVNLQRGLALLKGADLTVVPSLSEGGGLVNIEAQAAGCPVIASRAGGIPEYVKEDESGLLFEPGNVNELAERIAVVLSDESLRLKLIEGGYRHARAFDWEALAPRYIALYETEIACYNLDKEFKPWSPLTEDLWNELV